MRIGPYIYRIYASGNGKVTKTYHIIENGATIQNGVVLGAEISGVENIVKVYPENSLSTAVKGSLDDFRKAGWLCPKKTDTGQELYLYTINGTVLDTKGKTHDGGGDVIDDVLTPLGILIHNGGHIWDGYAIELLDDWIPLEKVTEIIPNLKKAADILN